MLTQRIQRLKGEQSSDGSFRFCFEGSNLTETSMLMFMHGLEIEDKQQTDILVDRLLKTQNALGTWKLYEDEEDGNLSQTIAAYAALLYSGRFRKEDKQLKKAEEFIKENGGLRKAHFMTRFMLTVNGNDSWPPLFYIPMTILQLPTFSPFHIYKLSNYARVHMVPMIVCGNKRFSIKKETTPDLSHLFVRAEEDRGDRALILTKMKELLSYPAYLHQQGYQFAERFMLERREGNGTFYSYASSTFFSISALLALGYERNNPTIIKALEGIKSFYMKTDDGYHLQNSPSTVWDTALLTYALQEAGVSAKESVIQQATAYLLNKQHEKVGDWNIHSKNTKPGGWGFSDVNTFVPDNDDTGATLRAIRRRAAKESIFQQSWNRGIEYLLSMQNKDGGWGAFEKHVDDKWLTLLPIENAEDAIIDPSTADLTGRVLEFLGNHTKMEKQHNIIQTAINWLVKNQERNGSWYGRWGVCYIYGTWAAVTGLKAAGISSHHPTIQKTYQWLLSIQHEDGGWGESCRSSEEKRYIPLSFSTPSQTAWALDALISICEKDCEAMKRGIAYINKEHSKKENQYPTGLGLPGNFYINYHSYNELFPLLALAHYQRKYPID